MSRMNEAKKAISRVFEDTSCSPEETAGKLLNLQAHVGEQLAALEGDGVDMERVVMSDDE